MSDNTPSLLASKDAKLGALFTAGFCADAPHLLAMGGASESLGVWDVRSVAAVAAKWSGLMQDATLPEGAEVEAAAGEEEEQPAAAKPASSKQGGASKAGSSKQAAAKAPKPVGRPPKSSKAAGKGGAKGGKQKR